jgi:diguanylate cyclase (GGDEF)-like protein/PAS domain S-box-containing protein
MSDNSLPPRSRPPGGAPGADAFYRQILDNLADGVYFVDTRRRITYWNRGAEVISGYAAADVVGHSCRDNLLVHTNAAGCQLCLRGCPLQATFRDGANRAADVFLKHRDGHRVPVSVRVSPIVGVKGKIVGGVEVFSENSSKLAALERAAEMERLALIDPLTGAGNRRYTEKVLREHCDKSRRDGENVAILFIDLDRFKTVNDAHGHAAGDAVLRAVARTIMNNLRSFDFLGRWGGEEFIAVLPGADAEKAKRTAARCCALVRSCSIDWGGAAIRPTISLGIALVGPGDSPEDLVSRSDSRLYLAKASGRDRFLGP